MTVTSEAIEGARARAGDTSYLHVPVTTAFLKQVRLEAASRDLSIRDFVIESILRNQKEDHAHGNSRK